MSASRRFVGPGAANPPAVPQPARITSASRQDARGRDILPGMGRRQRRRQRLGASGQGPVATSQYADREGNLLDLRNELTPGTAALIQELEARPGASAEDRWQRRTELLFERLAVRWEIAGLPIESQQELLGRYRMADSETRRWVRETIERHLREHEPELLT